MSSPETITLSISESTDLNPEKAREVLADNGMYVSVIQAADILEFLFKFAKIATK